MTPPRARSVFIAFSAALVLLSAPFLSSSRLRFDGSILRPLATLGACGVLYAWVRFRKLDRLEPAMPTFFWGMALSNVYLLPMHVISRLHAPLGDADLERADSAIHLHTATFVRHGDTVGALFERAYYLLLPFLLASVVVPPMLGKRRDSERLLLAIVFAAIPALGVYFFVHAAGPWVAGAFAPTPEQADVERLIGVAASGEWMTISFSDPAALVAFPSWHVILAIVAASGFWGLPRLRWPAAALGAIVVLSTLVTGWHYVVDVLGGIAFAAGSLALAHRFQAKEHGDKTAA